MAGAGTLSASYNKLQQVSARGWLRHDGGGGLLAGQPGGS
jgi:hypothetical protein